MKKIIFFLFTFCIPMLLNADSWTQKASLPGSARAGAIGVHRGNYGFVGLGKDASSYFTDLWKFEPATNSWTQMADLPAAGRAGAFGFVIGNNLYTVGGIDSAGISKEVWQYNTINNTWTQKNDFNTFRAGARGFVINSKAYMGSGITDTTPTFTNDLWLYNVGSDTWIQKNNLPGPARSEAIGMTINGEGYYGLGIAAGNNLLNDFWKYDTLSDSWTAKPNFGGTARFSASRFSLGEKGYIGTGVTSILGALSQEWWQYDTTSGQWMQKTDFTGTALAGCISFSIGAYGYVGMGQTVFNTYSNEIWEYSPDVNGIPSALQQNLSARFIPDPIVSSSFFAVAGIASFEDVTLIIYDVKGSMLKQIKINSEKTYLEKGKLPAGLYLYSLFDKNKKVLDGKFTIL